MRLQPFIWSPPLPCPERNEHIRLKWYYHHGKFEKSRSKTVRENAIVKFCAKPRNALLTSLEYTPKSLTLCYVLNRNYNPPVKQSLMLTGSDITQREIQLIYKLLWPYNWVKVNTLFFRITCLFFSVHVVVFCAIWSENLKFRHSPHAIHSTNLFNWTVLGHRRLTDVNASGHTTHVYPKRCRLQNDVIDGSVACS